VTLPLDDLDRKAGIFEEMEDAFTFTPPVDALFVGVGLAFALPPLATLVSSANTIEDAANSDALLDCVEDCSKSLTCGCGMVGGVGVVSIVLAAACGGDPI
jgi:hypothetical protein